MKIFVTIGTGQFEKLVMKVDELNKKIKEEVTIQIGRGEYTPKNCDFFRFSDNLDKYYEKADLIISHGGPGTVFEILRKNKPLIAVSNKDRTDPMHQVEFLEAISKTQSLLFCEDVDDLEEFLKKSKTFNFRKYNIPECTIDKEIITFLEK